MPLTYSQAITRAKEIIAIDLQNELKLSANRAIQGHKVQEHSTTGHLLRNIRVEATSDGIEFSFPYYAQYLEWGTGLYGPKKQVIRPKTAKVLSWEGADGKRHFASYVKGMTPAPFIRPVMHQKFMKIVADALNEAFADVEFN
jgi:hypothetical protein|tara:strand:+ start:43 stop:471 length:429 start_codon:yes stop_codon:yes gene_type:complete